ncbi:hypothetical protein SETIT_1G053700v2 [Setaria italica]|uniref:Uncharacterized protein n=1 Tax=Setaria italica TaxID=4555 RepID=A0A368PH49_SETIT|nr:hypothetical protein SETIT_1G053700v2 [Setaria italica]
MLPGQLRPRQRPESGGEGWHLATERHCLRAFPRPPTTDHGPQPARFCRMDAGNGPRRSRIRHPSTTRASRGPVRAHAAGLHLASAADPSSPGAPPPDLALLATDLGSPNHAGCPSCRSRATHETTFRRRMVAPT